MADAMDMDHEPGPVAGSQPRVSCVIPTHRRPALLGESLASVARQTCPPHEVLVVDDVGDPETARVVEQAATRWDLPVAYLDNTEGAGASSSRNAGARAATGDVLAFLDDDDRWNACYLEAAARALADASVDVVVTGLQLFDGHETALGSVLVEGLRAEDVLARNPGVTGSNLVLRREPFLQLGGYDEELWASNDKDLLVRLLDAGMRYRVVEERLVHLRVHRGHRLTQASQRRTQALRRYYTKYEPRLSRRDRWHLKTGLHGALRHTAPSMLVRLAHAICFVALLGPADAWRRYRSRHEFYSPPRIRPRPAAGKVRSRGW